MNTALKKLFLIDASTLIFRAYYAFIKNPRINSKKMNTSAIFGFFNSLLDVLEKEKPTHICVAIDPGTKTFRHEYYTEYKSNRDQTPNDIKISIPYIKDILKALNIAMYEIPYYEADDVIGSIAHKFKNSNFLIYLYTSDKDYFQLLDKNIFIYKPTGRGISEAEIIDVKKACDLFEVDDVKQIIDVLSLWGDSIDNVPGAPGIGEKNSKKLIKQFKSVENLLNNINSLEGKIKEILEKNKDKILLSKKLVTIQTNIEIKITEEDIKLKEPNFDKLIELFQELEFKNLLERYKKWYISTFKKENFLILEDYNQGVEEIIFPKTLSKYLTINEVSYDYKKIISFEEIYSVINEIKDKKVFSFDTETNSLDIINPDLVGISFCCEKNKAYYLPLPENKEEAKKLIAPFSEVFENKEILKIAHNLKFDLQVLKAYSINIDFPFFDTMIAHYLLDPEQKHNLNFLANVFLNYDPIPIENLIITKKSKEVSMRNVPIDKILVYCCEDSDVAFQLYNIFKEKLKENDLEDLFYNIEIPLIPVLAEMELTGVKINCSQLEQIENDLKKILIGLEDEIFKIAGTNFNLNSPKQLGVVLFEHLKIDDDPKLTKTKQYSTSEDELLKYIDKHPIIEKILEYRKIQKLISTYTESLPKLLNPITKKVHTYFNQVGTATGRLSSQNPNLQNIPVKDQKGREIRKAFVPSDGYDLILSADYSQIELRILAHMSEDQNLIEAFINNEDIHVSTASKIYKVNINEVSSEMRKKAKAANFGIIYGITAHGLAQMLRISRTEAKQLIDSYFVFYPKVKDYINQQINFARENLYVMTLFKRKRFLPDINSSNKTVKGYAERNAINTPIQGTASDIIKIAMNRVFYRLKNENLKTRLLLQIHDELVFETTNDELNYVISIVKDEMENACKLKVPLTVDIGIGKNWLEAHP